MSTSSKRKGDHAERELRAHIAELTGWTVKRMLRLGDALDCGDLAGLPDCTVQCKSYCDPARAMRDAMLDLETQRRNAGTPFAVAFVRRPGRVDGPRWVAVMTPDQFLTLLREATA